MRSLSARTYIAEGMRPEVVQTLLGHAHAEMTAIYLNDRGLTAGEWGVITLHRSVIDSATPGSLEIRNGVLNAALEYIAGRARLGAVDVLPFGEAAGRVYGLPYAY